MTSTRTSHKAAAPPRVRSRALALVIGLALAVAACGSNGTPAEVSRPDATSGEAAAESASHPLEDIALAYVAPAGGTDATDAARVMYWAAKQQFDACGGSFFVTEDERLDQAHLPDLERIRTEGIGMGRPIPSHSPLSDGTDTDTACTSKVIPAFTDADKVQNEWMTTVVLTTWGEDELAKPEAEATACLRTALGWSHEDLPTLDGFFGALDGQVLRWPDLSQPELQERVAALDEQGSAALIRCASEVYGRYAEELRAARPAFLDKHSETVTALAEALDQHGFAP